ncbi:hypothetical protein [uncultured Stenotrophomonas sp.]|uniref:hypothetical protein n=1 Tax=uncultured Stenotrophomonas sp. TaxID=165438 RepID=UPI0028E19723|nr:hypothetical protein [uncultured Stenotrophomonas sp.]
MSWGHAALELGPDADERAVRRAYAVRLRTTRPDDDPAAFQQLHEAYKAALAWLQRGGEENERGGWSDPVEQARTADARDPAEQGLNIGDVTLELVAAAAHTDPPHFEHWLQSRPELWSLHAKPFIGRAVLELLFTHNVPIPAQNFDLLAACFRWNDVGNGLDPYASDHCRSRSHRLWLLQPGNQEALARALHTPQRPVGAAEALARMTRLTRPWDGWQSVRDALTGKQVIAIGNTLHALGIHDPATAPEPLQTRQVAFWLALTRRDLNWPRLQMALVRSALCAAVVLAGMLALGFLQQVYASAIPAGGARLPIDFAVIAPHAALLVLVGGSLLLPFCSVLLWQVSAEYPQQRFRLLRLLLIPTLAVTALLLMHVADARTAGNVLAWSVMLLAAIRLLVRSGFDMGTGFWVVVPLLPIARFASDVLQYGEIGVVLALFMWTCDAVNQLPNKPGKRRR